MRSARSYLRTATALAVLALAVGSAGADLVYPPGATYTIDSDVTGTDLVYIGATLDFAGTASAIRTPNGFVDLTDLGPGSVLNGQAAQFIAGPEALVLVSPAFDPAMFGGGFTVEGVLHTVGSPLTIPAGTTIRGWTWNHSLWGQGVVRDHVTLAGRLEGGPWTLGGGIRVVPGGYANLRSGAYPYEQKGLLQVNDTISGMDGGTLLTKDLFVGTTANARFVQNDGTCMTSGSAFLFTHGEPMTGLVVGAADGLHSTYELHGGELTFDSYAPFASTAIGYRGSGTFIQTGGLHNRRYVYIGMTPEQFSRVSGRGEYLMSGGQLKTYFLQVGTWSATDERSVLSIDSTAADVWVDHLMSVNASGSVQGVAGATLHFKEAKLYLASSATEWSDLADMRLVFLPDPNPGNARNAIDIHWSTGAPTGPLDESLFGTPGTFGTIQLGEEGNADTSLKLGTLYVDTLILHAGSTLELTGTVYCRTLVDYGATVEYLNDSASLVVVPEPMSLALLGLGALALRRRR